jgi:hypothetical protein
VIVLRKVSIIIKIVVANLIKEAIKVTKAATKPFLEILVFLLVI